MRNFVYRGCDGLEDLDAWSGGNIMYSQYIFSLFALCRLV